MIHFQAIRLKRFYRWLLLVLIAFFTAFFLWVNERSPLSVFSEDETFALTKGSSDEPNIALTFNISWGEERVHDILKKLKEHGIKATFFVSGEWAERHPTILDKISEDEHEIGMLGYRYKNYLEQELEQVRKDLSYAREIFSKLGYDDVSLLRPPSGQFNEEILELAKNMNFQVIHWNVNPNDWDNPGTKVIINTVLEQTENGDIILLHASDSAKQTAEALDIILPGLTNKGFHFVSITEMINQAHAEAKLVD